MKRPFRRLSKSIFVSAFAVMIGVVCSSSIAESLFEKGVTAYRAGDYASAAHSWQASAEQGDRQAQFNLGTLYSRGAGVPRDVGTALSWFRKAAEQGHPEAQFNLGEAYRTGIGVSKDIQQAAVWYMKVADQGLSKAQNVLGVMYELGDGVPQNFEEAMKWYRKAVDQNCPEAQLNFANLYANGKGVEKNLRVANIYTSYAANQGLARAQVQLSIQLIRGIGTAKNVNQGIDWLVKAAQQGMPMAFGILGGLYADGSQVEPDALRAYTYFALATKLDRSNTSQGILGEGMPAERMNKVAEKLSSEQIQEAQRLAAMWEVGDVPPKFKYITAIKNVRPEGASLVLVSQDQQVHCDPLGYPDEARLYELEGAVILQLAIDANGNVTPRVVKSSGWKILDEATVKGVAKCRVVSSIASEKQPRKLRVEYLWKLEGDPAPASRPTLVPNSCSQTGKFTVVETGSPEETMFLRFLVTKDGKSYGIKIERGSNDMSNDKAAVEFLKNCSFNPSVRSGKSESGVASILLRAFNISNNGENTEQLITEKKADIQKTIDEARR